MQNTDAKPLCRILMPNLYAGVYMLPLWAVSKASSIKIKKLVQSIYLDLEGQFLLIVAMVCLWILRIDSDQVHIEENVFSDYLDILLRNNFSFFILI